MTDEEIYSPADVARAIGVSVTTVKRWVDAGVLPAHKTAGGHRKILLADVLRVVHEGNFPRVDLSRLGVHHRSEELATEKLSQRLFDALMAGDTNQTRAIIHGGYSAGVAMDELGDSVIAPAMIHLGSEWERGRIDVYHEHRSTLMCVAVLQELKPALQATAEAHRPIAVGGNPDGDHSVLASLLVQLVLIDAGWDVINLGPNTPMAAFRLAVRELQPRMMWLSVSHVPDAQTFLDGYREFYKAAANAGVAVAVGGQAMQSSLRATMSYTFYGDRLEHLAAFARTLHPRPC